MVINIPLNIPEELLENTIAKDYESKITENLTAEVRKIITNYDDSYYYRGGKDFNKGLERLVSMKIDWYLDNYKDEVVEAAADKLAERLVRTKKAKDLLEGVFVTCPKCGKENYVRSSGEDLDIKRCINCDALLYPQK